jgi:pyruvate/2-oxoglutarate/acetoin dehydrogenase E1 component
MKYKKVIAQEMEDISKNKKVKFLGYNVKYGHKMYNTLTKCNPDSLIETPVAENLIMGLAMGMSLEGFKPIVCFERSNFLLPALDAIINHLYGLPKMSGAFDFPVILRVAIPGNKPYDPGFQHLGDYTKIIEQYTSIPVFKYKRGIYKKVLKFKYPVCIIEKKEDYERDY